MTNKLLLLTGAITLGCAFAHAEDISIQAAATGLNSETAWGKDHPTATDDCWVYTYNLKGNNANETFKGRSLNIGSGTASSISAFNTGTLNLSAKTYTINSLVWWSGIIRANFNDKTLTVNGNCLVRQADIDAKHDLPIAKGGGSATFAANLSTEDSERPVIAMSVTAEQPDEAKMEAGSKSVFTLSGDNAGYAGAFELQTAYATLRLNSATAIGNPEVADPAAVILQNNAALSLGSDFAQNPSRGINIAGDNAFFMAYDGKNRTLAYPVSGTGTMTKRGAGALTLDGAYSAGDIVITNGALVITAAATISDAVRTVTVHDGCTLTLKQMLPATTTVDCKEGGTVVYDYDIPGVVPYDAENDTTTPLDFTKLADDQIPTDVSLSAAIVLPFGDSKALNMIKLATTSDLEADDFTDKTAKTAGLPFTSFEIVPGDGFKMLVLKARPVTVSVADFSDAVGINGNADTWSSGAEARDGSDYLLTNKVKTTSAKLETFAGDTLTAHDVTISQKNKPELCISNLFVSGSVNFTANGGTASAPLKLSGDKWTFVDTNATLTVTPIKGSSRYNQDLAAPLAGAGNLVLNVKEAGAKLYCRLSGDNSEFTGTITTACDNGKGLSWGNPGISVRPASSEALGGMTGWDKITLTDYALLCPTDDLTLGEADRGWFFDNGGFDIPEGVTLTFSEKFKLSSKSAGGDMAKLGEGTLALGGVANLSDKNSKKFYVYGGAVKILDDRAVKNMNFVMTNDTSIVLSADAGTENGIFGSLKPMAAGDKIKVTVDGAADIPVSILPICTVSTNNVDLTNVLDVQRIPGLGRPELVKERVTVGKGEYDRYSYKVNKPGFIIMIQ